MKKLSRKTVLFRVLIIISVLVSLWGWTSADFSNPQCQLTQNAAWISVDWTSKPVDEVAVRQLAESAQARNLNYLFPYVSYLKADGSFSASYDYAKQFVTTFRKFNKESQLLAWIGIPLANNRPIGIQGWVELANQETRQHIVHFIANLVEQ